MSSSSWSDMSQSEGTGSASSAGYCGIAHIQPQNSTFHFQGEDKKKMGERRPRTTIKNALFFPKTSQELDRRTDDSLSLKFHPFRTLHNIVTRDKKFFHTFGQFFWKIIDWMTRLDRIQGWIGTQNLSSSVSLWSDDQRKFRPIIQPSIPVFIFTVLFRGWR